MTDSSTPAFLVLGATGGIGSCLCKRLARKGFRLALGARTQDDLEALAGELTEAGAGDVATFEVEATDASSVQAFVKGAQERFGRLDGAAHLVGSILLKPAHLTTEKEWAETLDLNLSSAFYLLRYAAKIMSREGGSIVFASTAAARAGLPNHEAIAAAKAGLQGLTLSAAATYAARNLRVNCVAPGLVDTPLAARITGSEKALEASRSIHPLGRIGQPDEVASAIAWLLDPENSWVTGQILGLDGGLASLKTR